MSAATISNLSSDWKENASGRVFRLSGAPEDISINHLKSAIYITTCATYS